MSVSADGRQEYKGFRIRCSNWLDYPHYRTCRRVLAEMRGIEQHEDGRYIGHVPSGFGRDNVWLGGFLKLKPSELAANSRLPPRQRSHLRVELDEQKRLHAIWCKCGEPWRVDWDRLEPAIIEQVDAWAEPPSGWVDIMTSEL